MSGLYLPDTTVDKDSALIVAQKLISHLPKVVEDTSFVTGDSPAVIDVNDFLSKNGTQFTITNDGPGDFTVAVSVNGSAFSDEITLKQQEVRAFANYSIDTIRITWVADSSYRVLAL
jgi:hypothetical protein